MRRSKDRAWSRVLGIEPGATWGEILEAARRRLPLVIEDDHEVRAVLNAMFEAHRIWRVRALARPRLDTDDDLVFVLSPTSSNRVQGAIESDDVCVRENQSHSLRDAILARLPDPSGLPYTALLFRRTGSFTSLGAEILDFVTVLGDLGPLNTWNEREPDD